MSGRAVTFTVAAGLVVVWAVSGPFFGFSAAWQLTINTLTTIVTFLMVFVIQNTQNRDTEAMQIKLDELLRANTNISNEMLDLEDMPEKELNRLQRHYAGMAAEARRRERHVAGIKQDVQGREEGSTGSDEGESRREWEQGQAAPPPADVRRSRAPRGVAGRQHARRRPPRQASSTRARRARGRRVGRPRSGSPARRHSGRPASAGPGGSGPRLQRPGRPTDQLT